MMPHPDHHPTPPAPALEERVTRIHLARPGESLYADLGFVLELDDEGGGEYVVVRAQEEGDGVVRIDPGEWPALRATIDYLIQTCRP